MYMLTRIITKIFLVILLIFTINSCTKSSEFIFDDMYTAINEDPLTYKNNSKYVFEEINKNEDNFPSYAKNYNCELIYKVRNDSMLITYWQIAGKNKIQFITINGRNANHPFSRFIGKKADEVIKYYSKNTDYEISNLELRYNTEDWKSFIQFKIKDEKIYQIIVGENL